MFNLKRKEILLGIKIRKLNKMAAGMRPLEEVFDKAKVIKDKIEEIKRVNENLNQDQQTYIKILESNLDLIKWLTKQI